MTKEITIAFFGHPVSKSWLRPHACVSMLVTFDSFAWNFGLQFLDRAGRARAPGTGWTGDVAVEVVRVGTAAGAA